MAEVVAARGVYPQSIALKKRVSDQVRGQLVVGTSQAFSLAMRKWGGNLEEVMQALGRALDLKLLPSDWMKDTNQEIAIRAAQAVASGWRQRLPARAVPYPGTPFHPRFTGMLGDALSQVDLMTADTTDKVISFINVSALNEMAQHWYRVNYGAAGANVARGNVAQEYVVTFNGRPAFTMRDDSRPAPTMYLPRHYYSMGVGGEFVVLRGPADVRSRGVRPARFTELGFRSIEKNFGPFYLDMFREWLTTESEHMKLPKLGITVNQAYRLAARPVTR